MSGYENTLLLTREHRYYNKPSGQGKGDWLIILKACCKEVNDGRDEFAASWVRKRTEWFLNLRILVKYEILIKTGSSRKGQRTYYRFVDIEGVKKALSELEI